MNKYYYVLLIVLSTLSSCHMNTNLEKEIEDYLMREYDISVVVEKAKWDTGLAKNQVRYTAYFRDTPLKSFSGIYNEATKEGTDLSIDLILFNLKYYKVLDSLFPTNTVVNFNILPGKEEPKDLSKASLKEVNDDAWEALVHVYFFNEVDWSLTSPLIHFFENYPELKSSILIAFYPPELLDSEDLRSNNFNFSFNPQSFESSFEGQNLDQRTDHLELMEVNGAMIIKALKEKTAQQ